MVVIEEEDAMLQSCIIYIAAYTLCGCIHPDLARAALCACVIYLGLKWEKIPWADWNALWVTGYATLIVSLFWDWVVLAPFTPSKVLGLVSMNIYLGWMFVTSTETETGKLP